VVVVDVQENVEGKIIYEKICVSLSTKDFYLLSE